MAAPTSGALNRKKAPKLEFIKGLHLAAPDKQVLSNGLPVYSIGGLPQDAIKIELIFMAGKWFEDKKLIAKTTSNMLKEGTQKYTALQIAQELDYWGASFRTFSGADIATFTLFSLNKYLDKVLPVLEDIIKHPVFPQTDLQIFTNNSKEYLKVNLLKNDFVADRKFGEVLYGTTNPYGYHSDIVDYDMVTSEELAAFHQRFYNSGNCAIIVSGSIEPSVLALLQQHFGGDDWAGKPADKVTYSLEPSSQTKNRIAVKDSVQSAIRIGRPLFNKAHPDHHKLNFLNTLFGGYFGSRLMTNIREEKGYTYGIYSSLHSMLNSGYFGIGTEVGVDVCDAAIKEIYHEMNRLQQEAIPKQEVELVRNYLLGRLQSSLDGPFKISGLFKGLLIYDLNIDYIYALIETINTVTAADLQDLAIKYLNVDEMHEVVVG